MREARGRDTRLVWGGVSDYTVARMAAGLEQPFGDRLQRAGEIFKYCGVTDDQTLRQKLELCREGI